MTPQEIEDKAKELGVTPKEVLNPKVEEKIMEPIKLPDMQHVIVTFADGRRGVFSGPAIISSAELKLAPPQLVSIDFSDPRPMGIAKQPDEKSPDVTPSVVEKTEEVKPSENQGIEDQGNK